MSYGVRRVERPLSPDEARLVDERLAAWEADRHASDPLREFVGVAAVAGAAVLLGFLLQVPGLVVGGLGVALFVLALVVATRRRRATGPLGPWHPPPGGWTAVDTIVRARSVVGAASGDEDYEHWLLFEIPGDDWFFVSGTEVRTVVADPAREELRLTTLAPGGRLLAGSAHGARLPRLGALPHGADYAAAVERGQVWRPGDLPIEDDEGGRVATARLPGWIREAAGA